MNKIITMPISNFPLFEAAGLHIWFIKRIFAGYSITSMFIYDLKNEHTQHIK